MIPKFRAYIKKSKKIYPVNDLTLNGIDDEPVGINGCGDSTCTTCLDWYRFEDIELMQSTGLKGYMNDKYEDDQEKDVYKGDIIDIFWEEWPMGYYQENHMIGVVDKDETGTAWIIKNAKYEFDIPKPIPSEIDGISVSMSLPDDEDLEEIFLHNFNLTSDDVTILGNIYENPELLEAIE